MNITLLPTQQEGPSSVAWTTREREAPLLLPRHKVKLSLTLSDNYIIYSLPLRHSRRIMSLLQHDAYLPLAPTVQDIRPHVHENTRYFLSLSPVALATLQDAASVAVAAETFHPEHQE